MNSASNRLLLLLDDFLEDWAGFILPRPAVAMRNFVQEDGCMWCGETIQKNELCPCPLCDVFFAGLITRSLSHCTHLKSLEFPCVKHFFVETLPLKQRNSDWTEILATQLDAISIMAKNEGQKCYID